MVDIRSPGWSEAQPWVTRGGTPAPQCGTGDLARQIAENGFEIGQTPGPGWSEAQSEAQPWVLNVNATRSERAPEGSERVSSNVGIGPGARSVTLLLNLTPLQGDSLLWNALPGVKTPGLRPLAPSASGRRAPNTHDAPAYYQGARPGRYVYLCFEGFVSGKKRHRANCNVSAERLSHFLGLIRYVLRLLRDSLA